MAWVKLTRKTGGVIYVNMDRFDKVETVTDDDGEFTRITSYKGQTDLDRVLAIMSRLMPEE